MRSFHNDIGRELFSDGGITWTRIITFISFSALFAEHVIQQQSNNLSRNLIITSVIDWTTNFIETDLRTWLESQNYWVKIFIFFFEIKLFFLYFLKSGCSKIYDKTPQRRNSTIVCSSETPAHGFQRTLPSVHPLVDGHAQHHGLLR